MILVLDCETTGIDPSTDSVVEVAAVPLTRAVQNPDTEATCVWDVCPGASSLVAPGRRVPPAARAVHHLSDEELRSAPKLRGAITDVVLRAGYDPSKHAGGLSAIACHNADFDKGFVGAFFSKDIPWLCTWRCALHLFPEAQNHSNQTLRYAVPGVDAAMAPWSHSRSPEHMPHRALYDATTTAFLLQCMLQMRSLGELLELQRQPVLQKTVRFGKHRGVPWADVPKDYCRWVLRAEPPFDRDVEYTARHHLETAR